jgi:hypothetical protein
MAARRETNKVAQAWIELKADDLEAASALEVAKHQLAAGQDLKTLRRIRLIELEGRLPARERLEELLHGSTQFYNPHKERCVIRMTADEAPPLHPGERAVLVIEREGARRAAAERWWEHETGDSVTVREGVAWALTYEPGSEPDEDLALVRGRRHGLLCNPHSQDCRWAEDSVPVPWIEPEASAAPESAPTRRRSSSSTRSRR